MVKLTNVLVYMHNIVCKAIALLSEGLAIADLQMRQLNHDNIFS